MKVTFPHMGNLHIVVKSMLDELGIESKVPPQTSKRTLNLGVKYSPEGACLPFKVNLGNFIEVLEEEDPPDTLLMIGDSGKGSCRLGFYAKIQERILKRLGYNFKMVTFSNKSGGSMVDSSTNIAQDISKPKIAKAFWHGFQKLRAIEKIEDLALETRPYEINIGDTTKVYGQSIKKIEQTNPRNLKRILKENISSFQNIQQDRNRNILNLLEIGELFVVRDNFINLFYKIMLGEMRVRVHQTFYLSRKFLEQLGLDKHKKHALKEALPYLGYDIGAECNLAIGDTIIGKENGYDGALHLMPFGCMPEIVAQSILPKVSREHDMPILTLILDEQTGEVGLRTRLEALVEMLFRKKEGQDFENFLIRYSIGGYGAPYAKYQ